MPCKHGQIYPYSDKLLAVHVKGHAARRKLAGVSGIVLYNWSDDGEAIFLFAPALFDKVGEIVRPRWRRRLSVAHRQKLVEAGIDALKSCRKTNSKRAKTSPGQAIGQELISEVG
jgi:hypothetical protein